MLEQEHPEGVRPSTEAKRDQIRQAAQRLFLQNGYADTTMDAITAAAGVSKQTLYRYFPSKDALFVDILTQMLTEHSPNPLTQQIERLPFTDYASLEAALLALAQAIVDNAMQPAYLALVRVIVAEAPRVPQLTSLFRTAIIGRGGAGVIAILNRAQKQGLVGILEPEAATRLFVGPLLTYILGDGLFAGEGSPRPPTREQLTALVRLFLRAVLPYGSEGSHDGAGDRPTPTA